MEKQHVGNQLEKLTQQTKELTSKRQKMKLSSTVGETELAELSN